MATVLVIAIAMYYLTEHHIIFPIEVLGEDFTFAGSPEKSPSNNTDPGVTLVEITEEDYQCASLFDGKNPLRRDLLYELINKVASPGLAKNPRTVVVDIDLSGSWEPPPLTTYKASDLACSNGKEFPFKSALPPLNIALDKLVVVEPTRIVRGADGKSVMVLADDKFSVRLKGENEAKEALSIFPYDWDHRARSFLKHVEVRKGTAAQDFAKCESFPTLPTVGEKAGMPSEGGWNDCKERDEEERYFINFPKARIKHRYTASAVLTENNLPLDEIVVIGGTYYAGRDSYLTPVGMISGMELVGLSINAVQNAKAIGKAKEWMQLVADILIGASLVILDIGGFGVTGTLLTLTAIVVLPLATSLLIFQTVNLFLNFVPIVLGAGAHMIYDRHQEVKTHNKSLEHRLKVAKSQAGDLRKKLHHLQRQRHDLRLRNEELRQSGITENFNISIDPSRHGDEN